MNVEKVRDDEVECELVEGPQCGRGMCERIGVSQDGEGS